MQHWLSKGLLLALAVGGVACAKSESESSIAERAEQGKVALVEQGDPAMEAAFDKARATLMIFLRWRPIPSRGRKISQ